MIYIASISDLQMKKLYHSYTVYKSWPASCQHHQIVFCWVALIKLWAFAVSITRSVYIQI